MTSTASAAPPAKSPMAGMSPQERRSSMTLASIYGLRMLGLFLILPVFAIYTRELPGGDNHALVGLALGIYGLTQAMLQIPFGIASDRFGRKPVMMLGLLIFAIGSFMAGGSRTLTGIIIGRAVQGAGAISAAISAMIADSTRDEHRTKAMAIVGMTIGMSFLASLIAAPLLYHVIGVPGMFVLTGVLALVAIAVVKWIVPDAPMTHRAEELGPRARGKDDSIFSPALLRLHFSIFVVNFTQVAMFVVVPIALVRDAGIAVQDHWMVYLPVTLGSFLLAVPGIIWAESRGHMRKVFIAAVALMMLTMLGFAFDYTRPVPLIGALFLFFVSFNLMEALIPSLVSRTAPPARKGLALGVYNTAQSLGLFAGGAVGGWIAKAWSSEGVFLACAALSLVWLAVAWFIEPPPKRGR
ncbi:MAG: Inner membrane transport protein YajR [Burkholderiaceae bacterium]|jgi:MFS family permease|nr:MAG: Inner membrane transport protein YajR [Burkholderiaceae bacterium]